MKEMVEKLLIEKGNTNITNNNNIIQQIIKY